MTPSENVPQALPNDQDAEQAVICAMLFDKDAVAEACEFLTGEDFYRPDFARMFESMVELNTRSVPVDVFTLSDKLNEKGLLEQIGGRTRILQIAAGFITSANIQAHAKIVAEKSILRKLIHASREISRKAFGPSEETSVILEFAQKLIFDIAQGGLSVGYTHVREVMAQVLDRIELLHTNKGRVFGVSTGFDDLDRKTQGLQPSDLILVGARPSMGKTAFLLNIAQHAAIKGRVPTVIFSLEMSKEQLGNRLLSAEARVDSMKLSSGNVEGDDWDRIFENLDSISDAPLFIDDTPGITIPEMRARCRRLKLERNLGLIVVDYLQLMSGSGPRRIESRQIEVSEISRGLKGLAKELNVPVLVAAQLSRAVESRKSNKPMLSDLRESGAIEQDADVVTFLYREVYYNPQTLNPYAAELIIAKHRNGPTGTVELTYRPELTKFESAARHV